MLVFSMLILKLDATNLKQVLRDASETLKAGGIVAYPTETFYGLGAKFDIEKALRKIYELKQRPDEKAIPLIIGNRELLSVITASVSNIAESLINRFWPGPLTLIFHAKKNLSEYITAGTCKVAVRIPGESFALRLAKTAGFPITATSANPSGLPPARDAGTLTEYFGDKIDLIIDGGYTTGDLPSSIVDVTGDEIIIMRNGVIKKELLTS